MGHRIDWDAVLAPTFLILGSNDAITTYEEMQPYVDPMYYSSRTGGFKVRRVDSINRWKIENMFE